MTSMTNSLRAPRKKSAGFGEKRYFCWSASHKNSQVGIFVVSCLLCYKIDLRYVLLGGVRFLSVRLPAAVR